MLPKLCRSFHLSAKRTISALVALYSSASLNLLVLATLSTIEGDSFLGSTSLLFRVSPFAVWYIPAHRSSCNIGFCWQRAFDLFVFCPCQFLFSSSRTPLNDSSGSHGFWCQLLLESFNQLLSLLYSRLNYRLFCPGVATVYSCSQLPWSLLFFLGCDRYWAFDIYRIPIMSVIYCLIDYWGCLFSLTIQRFADSCHQLLLDLLLSSSFFSFPSFSGG